jgi:hypothetical protein
MLEKKNSNDKKKKELRGLSLGVEYTTQYI